MKTTSLLLLFYISFSLISCNTPEKNDVVAKSARLSGKEVIGKLDSLGFFNITDKEKLDSVKMEMIGAYDNYGYFSSLTYHDSLIFMDHRFYIIDQEELFELGGLTKYLVQVQTTFNLLGLKLEYKNEDNGEELSINKYWNHTIEVNGKVYESFKGKINESSWGIATLNFATMLNEQLKLQNSDNQVYLIHSGNDGMLVFLTPQMFEIVSKYYLNDYNRPMSVEQWKKYYKIE